MASEAGKGDRRRPRLVSIRRWEKNYNKVFPDRGSVQPGQARRFHKVYRGGWNENKTV